MTQQTGIYRITLHAVAVPWKLARKTADYVARLSLSSSPPPLPPKALHPLLLPVQSREVMLGERGLPTLAVSGGGAGEGARTSEAITLLLGTGSERQGQVPIISENEHPSFCKRTIVGEPVCVCWDDLGKAIMKNSITFWCHSNVDIKFWLANTYPIRCFRIDHMTAL